MSQAPPPSRVGCSPGPGCAILLALVCAAVVAVTFGYVNFSFWGGNPGGAGGGPTPSPTPTARATPSPTPRLTPSPTPGPGTTIPTISARSYTGGSTPVTVTGSFGFSSTIALHPPASYSDGTETTLSYGWFLGSDGLLLAFSQREGADGLGLNVQSGPWIATYLGEGCTWEVEVTDVTLSGHVSCTDIPAVNEADGTTGVVDIELDFSADS